MTKHMRVFAILFLPLVFLFSACSRTPPFKEVDKQIRIYYHNSRRQALGYEVNFKQSLSIQKIRILDQKRNDDNLIVICNVTIIPRKSIDSGVGHLDLTVYAYSEIFGSETFSAQSGLPFTREVQFEFSKFDSGWKLKDPKLRNM